MPTIETRIEIARPPEIVAEAFLDPANAVHWTKDLERLEIISGSPGEVGSVARLHYSQRGRPYVLVDTLADTVPNEYFRSTVEGGGIKAEVETWLRKKNDGTEVTIRWRGSGTMIVTRLLLPFMRGVIRRRTRSDLAAFRKLVEANGAHFYR